MLTTMDFYTVITLYPMKKGREPIYLTDEDIKTHRDDTRGITFIVSKKQ